jgi:GPH family glycoside/pentoside/hexuronide:cation symporter
LISAHEKHSRHVTQPEDRIPIRQLVAFGFGGIIPIALFNIAGQLMVLIGNISLGLSAFWLGVIIIIPRLWDAVSDPIVGHLSDNTRTRWGRRRPYLLVGGIAVAISFVLMWWIPTGAIAQSWFPTEAAFQWFQLGYILFWLLVFFTSCTVFEIPHGALGMEMSPDYHERTRLFSAKSFLGNLFAMSTPWLFALANMDLFKGPGGNEADGMRYVSMIIAAALIPLSFWWFLTVREPAFTVVAKQEKSPFWKDMKHTASNKTFLSLVAVIFTLAMGFNFVALLGYYIPIFYIFEGDKSAASTLLGINGTIWAVTGLIAVFPLNWLSRYLGKRHTLIIAIVLMCLAQLSKIVCYNPEFPYLIIIPTILLSTGMLFFFTLGASMVGDICDEDDLRTGHRSEGSYYSVYWWFIKMGTAFASFVTGMLIMFTQFDQTQVALVDDLQGSIRQVQAQAQPILADSREDQITGVKILFADTLDQANSFLIFLDREALKSRNQLPQTDSANRQREEQFSRDAATRARSTINKLEEGLRHLSEIDSASSTFQLDDFVQTGISLATQTGLDKARVNSFALSNHLQARSEEVESSPEHYEYLLRTISQVNDKLTFADMQSDQAALRPDLFVEELRAIEEATTPLMLQAPHTLLLMRVVEIGLPLLLSLISIFFALRYSLSEERCYAIKAALKVRNETRLSAASD